MKTVNETEIIMHLMLTRCTYTDYSYKTWMPSNYTSPRNIDQFHDLYV